MKKKKMFENISSAPYLSGYTYRTFADHAICDPGDTTHMQKVCHGINPQGVQPGDILYVTGVKVKEFFTKIAPAIDVPFFVITAQWDAGPDESLIPLFSRHLVKWFTINANIVHEKIVPIPLGLQNLHWRHNGNIQSDPLTYAGRAAVRKNKTLLASFSMHNNIGERTTCLNMAHRAFGGMLDVRQVQRGDRENDAFVRDYFNKASRYKFILCPWGAGIDTHRLWEAMYMGCIPVTKYHECYRDFKRDKYPIVFMDDWSELSMLCNSLDHVERLFKKPDLDDCIYSPYWKELLSDERSHYTDRPIQGV